MKVKKTAKKPSVKKTASKSRIKKTGAGKSKTPKRTVDLSEVFNSLKPLLSAYSKQLAVRSSAKGRYELYSEKKINVAGKPRDEIFFASIIIKKNYVGFYYMPVYVNADLKKVLGPDLLKTLKGKSCFYIKNTDPELLGQIKDALSAGFKSYKQKGWI